MDENERNAIVSVLESLIEEIRLEPGGSTHYKEELQAIRERTDFNLNSLRTIRETPSQQPSSE